MKSMKLRIACSRDLEFIADLHADSWRRHYRGAFLDSFLERDVFAERLAVWSERLTRFDEKSFTVVAEDHSVVIGFAHTILDHDVEYGALLDNLHVRHDQKRRRVGSALLTETAAILLKRWGKKSGLYLWVLDQNKDAQAFYASLGAIRVGRQVCRAVPGGGMVPSLRYYWPDPATLLEIKPTRDI